MGIRVSFDRSDPSLDVMAYNAATGSALKLTDLAIYDLLCAAYQEAGNDDHVSFERFKVMTEHPMYRFFGWETRTCNIMSVKLDGIVGSCSDKAAIALVLQEGGFSSDAARYIRSISWG
jgi:hypothetical protein